MRTVIHNLRILITETVWGHKYQKIFTELVEKFEEFFCEEIDHSENIERHDYRERLENHNVNFDDEDENCFIEESDSTRFLEASDTFQDDGGCEDEENKLAFNLSRIEIDSRTTSEEVPKKSKSRRKIFCQFRVKVQG